MGNQESAGALLEETTVKTSDGVAIAKAGQEPVNDGSVWNPELAEHLYNILYLAELGGHELESALKRLEKRYRDAVYSELIYILSHLRFEAAVAKRYWKQIVKHREMMQTRLGGSVDLRVALASFFMQVNRKLKNPKIIELQLFERTRASAFMDKLTGLHNYRAFTECLAQEIMRAERHGTPLSLIMVDVDNFKLYNDSNGHEAGNRALATIAKLLREAIRKIDFPARYGGEEFALLLPLTPKAGAQQVAERARETIAEHFFPLEESQPDGRLTVSMGIATYPADARDSGLLIRRADGAMYLAKTNGRNAVQLYGNDYRTYRRIDAALEGRFRALDTDFCPLRTIDVSEGGFRFVTDRDLPERALIDMALTLPNTKREIRVAARVVQTQRKAADEIEVGVRIVDLEMDDRCRLEQYLRMIRPGCGDTTAGD